MGYKRDMRWLLLVVALSACADVERPPGQGQAPGAAVAPATLPVVAPEPSVRVRVISAGSEPRRQLRFTPKAGDRRVLSLEMALGMEMKSGPHRMFDQEGVMRGTIALVVERVSAGEIEMAMTVVALDVPTWGPAPRPPDLTGKRGSFVASDRGEVLAKSLPFLQELDDTTGFFHLSDWLVLLPAEPVGVGAVWELESTDLRNGLLIEIVERHTLVELGDDGGRTTYVHDQRVEPQRPDDFARDPITTFEVISASSTGAGELRFAFDRPVAALSLTQFVSDYAMKIRAPGSTQDVAMSMKARFRASSE
jgi:hypothetical protein